MLSRITRPLLFPAIPIVFVLCSLIVACSAVPPPKKTDNICAIFEEYNNWYWAAKDTANRWHVPISIQMAIIFQESSYRAKIRPPRSKLFWFIPWTRPSSAYGYAQASNKAWGIYKEKVGHFWSSRSNFKHASDFIGWYVDQAHRRAHISKNNPYSIYLAYHEGIGGYLRGTYRRKLWLMKVARSVSLRSKHYQHQLKKCQKKLSNTRIHWWLAK